MMFLTDPVVVLVVRWGLAAVFVFAVIHKLSAMPEFVVTLGAYRLLPAPLTTPLAWLLVAIELLVALGLLANSDGFAMLAAGWLCLYALAMLINLMRGRRDLDCGCGGPVGRQNISGALVLRNLALAAVALLSAWPPEPSRSLAWLDWFTVLAASTTMVLIWAAASQLSSTRTTDRFTDHGN